MSRLLNDRQSAGLTARLTAVRRYGDFTLAYNAAVHPGLEYFSLGRNLEDGFLAYRTVENYTFALGDPVAAADRAPECLRAFVAEKGRPIFVQATDPTARTLHDLGYFLTDLGPDPRLDLQEYSLSGKPKEWLRYAANWCARRGYVVEEAPDESGLSPEEIEAVSAAWRETLPAGTREVIFMNRPLIATPEPDVRRFVLRDREGVVQNYVFFDPLYRDGRPFGYVTCIKRRRPTAPSLGEAAIMKYVIEAFQEEGVEQLRLGLCPLAGGADGRWPKNPYRENWLLRIAFQLGFKAGWINGGLYALANHAAYKRRFRGEEDRTYYASMRYSNTRPILALTRMMGVLGNGE
ncbi:MAG: phosphatidylglycerol lysyltransferase domain-containing protein [Planctomycetota bacterium]